MTESATKSETTISLEAPFDQPLFARALRAPFSRQHPPSLSLPDALSKESLKTIRELVEPKLQAFDLADRGRYRYLDLITAAGETPELTMGLAYLLSSMRALASEVSGKSLLHGAARIVWFERGDYALRLDDSFARTRQAFIEAALDLSPEGEIPVATMYSELPLIHLPIAQLPGQITLIERSAANYRYDRFRSCLMGDRAYVLLRTQFPLAES